MIRTILIIISIFAIPTAFAFLVSWLHNMKEMYWDRLKGWVFNEWEKL